MVRVVDKPTFKAGDSVIVRMRNDRLGYSGTVLEVYRNGRVRVQALHNPMDIRTLGPSDLTKVSASEARRYR